MCTCLSVHLLFGMSWVCVHIHVIVYLMYGADLVIYLIREGFVGDFGGGNLFCFRNANRKILHVFGIHLVCWGQFSY